MTVGISTTNLANAWLNVLKNTTLTGLATPTVKIHTGDPGASGTANVSAGSSAANSATWSTAASSGSISPTTLPSAWTNGGTSETLTHVSVWFAGTFYFSAALSSSQAWASGNTFTLSSLSISLAPLAA